MQRKFRTWTYNNFHFVLGLFLGDLFFYFALLREWMLVLFFIVFFFLNFYFLKGAKLILSTFLAPIPFFIAQSFFNLNIILLTLVWFVALIFLWKKEKIFWLFYVFLILLISQFILGNVLIQPFFVIFSIFFFIFLLIFVIFGQKSSDAFIKSFITSEFLWLLYFLPIGFIIRATINFIFFYIILNQGGLSFLKIRRPKKEEDEK